MNRWQCRHLLSEYGSCIISETPNKYSILVAGVQSLAFVAYAGMALNC